MGLRDLRDRACIVGVGDTPQGAVPDKTGDELVIDAARAALEDCGLKKDDIDGLCVQRSFGRQGDYLKVGLMLGTPVMPCASYVAGAVHDRLQTSNY